MLEERRSDRVGARALVAAALIVVAALAAEGLGAGRAAAQSTPPAGPPGMAMTPEHMAAMHKQMMADHAAADARLRPLVDRMNAAKGDARVDAMAAVVAALVSERATMRGHMDHLAQMMTPEMMGTMMSGMTSEMRQMAAQCPMMKGMAQPSPAP